MIIIIREVKINFLSLVTILILIILAVAEILLPKQAEAEAIHPLLNNYQEIKTNYPFINKLLATGNVNDAEIKAWIEEVENVLNREIINQGTNFANANQLIFIMQATFDVKIISEEIAVILGRAMGKEKAALARAGEKTAFKDDQHIASWARGYIVTAVTEGLVKGYPDGTFGPKNNATRAIAGTMAYRYMTALTTPIKYPQP